MKALIGLCAATVAAAMLSGCYGGYYDRGPGYGYGYGYGYGPGPRALDACDGYYDDYYGSFDDGCWGDDGGFWYRARDGHYHRDRGGHFSRNGDRGMHPVHGRGPGPGAHFHGEREGWDG